MNLTPRMSPVAFLVDTDKEDEMERVIENLAHGWRGWMDVRLLGPMAAYDFVRNAHTGS